MNKAEKLLASFGLEKKGEKLLDVELQSVWAKILERFPELSRVEIIVPDKDKTLSYTGGEFILPDDENPNPAIVILPEDGSVYERLKETRPLAIKITAEMLGKTVGELSGEDIKKFIFLHEVGHTYDFISNFENDPQIGKDEAVYTWNMLHTEQMNSLPVPGQDPNDLKMSIEGIEDISDFLQKRPGLEMKMEELNIKTIQDLLDQQEIAYRGLPKESFADKFAAKYFMLQ